MNILTKSKATTKNFINRYKLGDRYVEKWVPTTLDIKKYAELSGDFNPIHLSKDEYKLNDKTKYIVHGNLTCSVISKVIGMNFPGNNSLIIEQNVSFTNPIFPNDIVKFEFIIVSINYDLKVLEIKIKASKVKHKVNEKKHTVLRGKVICKL